MLQGAVSYGRRATLSNTQTDARSKQDMLCQSTTVNVYPQDSHLALNHAVEVIGKVDGNLAVKVQASTDFGLNIGTSITPIVPSPLHPRKYLLSNGSEVESSDFGVTKG
jgi:hypothetical protein